MEIDCPTLVTPWSPEYTNFLQQDIFHIKSPTPSEKNIAPGSNSSQAHSLLMEHYSLLPLTVLKKYFYRIS